MNVYLYKTWNNHVVPATTEPAATEPPATTGPATTTNNVHMYVVHSWLPCPISVYIKIMCLVSSKYNTLMHQWTLSLSIGEYIFIDVLPNIFETLLHHIKQLDSES